MGAQHRPDGSDALVSHLPQPVAEGSFGGKSIIDDPLDWPCGYPSAAGEARPSGGP